MSLSVITLAWLLSASVTVLGPGTLAPADPGLLEKVAHRRAVYGWTDTGDWQEYDVLVAPANCDYLGRAGWIYLRGKRYTALVVDCEARHHQGQMERRNILADVNRANLGHKKGWLVLR
jgi:hypothetical protein